MASSGLRVECDRARVVVPEALRGEVRPSATGGGPPFEVRVRSLVVVTREDPPEVVVGGADFSVVAEGRVRVREPRGSVSVEEGPFVTVLVRNGRVLRR